MSGDLLPVTPEGDVYTPPLLLARASFLQTGVAWISRFGNVGVSLWVLTSEIQKAKAHRLKSQPQKRYALCALNIFISSAEGPYIPGISTLFRRRYTPSCERW